MNNVKKVIMSVCVVMMVVGLCVGCSSSSKPPEEIIKNIIMQYALKDNGLDINDKNITNLKFASFNITNGFVSKTPGGGGESNPYNIDVDYRISYIYNSYLADYKISKINEYNKEITSFTEYLNSKKLLINSLTTEIASLRVELKDIMKAMLLPKAEWPTLSYLHDLDYKKQVTEGEIRSKVGLLRDANSEISRMDELIKGRNQMINELNQLPDTKQDNKEIVNNGARYSFVKKGDKWYGFQGWK